MAQPQPEKRFNRRFVLDLPIAVKFFDNQPQDVSGHTRDVSSRGVFFYMDAAIHEGSSIEFVMTLPSEITQTEPVRVHCSGTVVRVEEETETEQGVAVAIEKYDFVKDA